MSGERSLARRIPIEIIPVSPALRGWPGRTCGERTWLFSAQLASIILNTINLQTILYKSAGVQSGPACYESENALERKVCHEETTFCFHVDAFAFADACPSQTRPAMYTAGLQNGRAWSLLDDFAKLAWVVGCGEGIQMAEIEAMRANDDKDEGSALTCAARISTNLHYVATYAGNLTPEEAGIENLHSQSGKPFVFCVRFSRNATVRHFVAGELKGWFYGLAIG